MAVPICGGKTYSYTYCAENYMCQITELSRAQYTRTVDAIYGDTCKDVATKCPC